MYEAVSLHFSRLWGSLDTSGRDVTLYAGWIGLNIPSSPHFGRQRKEYSFSDFFL